MKKVILITVIFIMMTPTSSHIFAKSYPRQGGFKQLLAWHDSWFFIDKENWYIHAPDKWQHFSGCYLAQRIGTNFLGKYQSAGIIILGAIAKEYDDAYREGWSARDMLCNILGLLAGMNQSQKFQVIANLTPDKIELQVYLPLNL